MIVKLFFTSCAPRDDPAGSSAVCSARFSICLSICYLAPRTVVPPYHPPLTTLRRVCEGLVALLAQFTPWDLQARVASSFLLLHDPGSIREDTGNVAGNIAPPRTTHIAHKDALRLRSPGHGRLLARREPAAHRRGGRGRTGHAGGERSLASAAPALRRHRERRQGLLHGRVHVLPGGRLCLVRVSREPKQLRQVRRR